MNIQKTNRIGIALIRKGFIGNNKLIEKMGKNAALDSYLAMTVNSNLFRHRPNAKVLRVSKSIIDACTLIDFKSIKENISESNFDFESMYVLLDNDKSGVIKVERMGSDFSFIMLSNLGSPDGKMELIYNSYNFIANDFYIDKSDAWSGELSFYNYEKSVFVVQLLTYLVFGDITQRHIPAKAKVNAGVTRISNNSPLNITFCDSLWKQRINVEGFKVRGHFRLQPYGEKLSKRKLIWIEEFEKHGYNRRATIEIQKDKDHDPH